MRKVPKCPICGGPHYKYMCFQNPKRKYALKRKYSAYKVGKTPKRDKVLSSSKSLVRKRLILELDKYCSLCVRIAAADKNGIATCYCCGRRLPWKCMHNGHFKSRQFQGTRFDFDNMKCTCEVCNVTLHGNLKKYREHLIREIGEDRVNALDRKKSQKISTPELEELLVKVKLKYKQLLEAKKNDQNTL